MTSETSAREAFVWIWLPGAVDPVVCGRLDLLAGRFAFTYARSYRDRPDAIALSPVELPIQEGTATPSGMKTIHACLRDAAPDAWGRRVIAYRHPALPADELDYLLLSGSNRIGALDFQASPSEFVPRGSVPVTLEELVDAAARVQSGQPLAPDLDAALLHGTSVGGARPKAVIEDGTRQFIAKFSAATDTYDLVKAEFVAMRLAKRAGLDVAPVELRKVMGRDVLLVERFDRVATKSGVVRRSLLSALALLGLDEREARYASYVDFATIIRQRFEHPSATLRELFRRLVFNILVGNTDDHARNHAALWDGRSLRLSPAYDLCPQRRTGREASQGMGINGARGNLSTLENAISIAGAFLIPPSEARQLADELTTVVDEQWSNTCDEAELSTSERRKLLGTTVLNPFAFDRA